MINKWIELSLAITTFLSGLSGGIGFFTVMGGNPALSGLSDRTFAEYWQHIDSYMAARMPLFGPLLMLSVLTSTVLLFREWRSLSFWCMLTAFLVVAGDAAFAVSVNHPLNQLIQGWNLNSLPTDVQEIKTKVIKASNVRIFLMIGAFALVVIGVWSRKGK